MLVTAFFLVVLTKRMLTRQRNAGWCNVHLMLALLGHSFFWQEIARMHCWCARALAFVGLMRHAIAPGYQPASYHCNAAVHFSLRANGIGPDVKDGLLEAILRSSSLLHMPLEGNSLSESDQQLVKGKMQRALKNGLHMVQHR